MVVESLFVTMGDYFYHFNSCPFTKTKIIRSMPGVTFGDFLCPEHRLQTPCLPPVTLPHGISKSKKESARLFALASATSSYLIVFLPFRLAMSRLFVANSFTNSSRAAVHTIAASF